MQRQFKLTVIHKRFLFSYFLPNQWILGLLLLIVTPKRNKKVVFPSRKHSNQRKGSDRDKEAINIYNNIIKEGIFSVMAVKAFLCLIKISIYFLLVSIKIFTFFKKTCIYSCFLQKFCEDAVLTDLSKKLFHFTVYHS